MRILSLLTLLNWGVIFSPPATNAPEIINPLLACFIEEADARGVEVRREIAALNSIQIVKQPFYKGQASDGIYYFSGNIVLKASIMRDKETARGIRLLFHELGHVFGLDDCDMCFYNIMRAASSPRANYLFKDEYLRAIYLDEFFEAIKDPDKYNQHHKHR